MQEIALLKAEAHDRMTGGDESALDRHAIMAALNKILNSPDFPASARNKRFLQLVVENSLIGKKTPAYEVAVKAFCRPPSFDHVNDPIVRIEAAKLRRDLETYYLKGGKRDPFIFEFARGRYFVRFVRNSCALRDVDPAREELLILRAALLGLADGSDEAGSAWRSVLREYPGFLLDARAHAALRAVCGDDQRIRELVLCGLRRAAAAHDELSRPPLGSAEHVA